MLEMNDLTMLAMFMLIILVTGGIMAAMPWLEGRGQCFAVTIPVTAAKDPRLEAERRSYASKVALLAVVCGAGTAAATAMDQTGSATVAVLLASTAALVMAPFVLMLAARKRVRAIKAAEGWHAERQVRVAAIGEADLPRPLSPAFELLHLPVAMLALGLGLAVLPGLPARVPIHFDAAGNANDWVDRGPAVVALPILIIAFMGIVMTAVHLAITRSKRASDPEAPATSAFCYAAFVRANTVLIVVIGLVVNLAFALLPLQFAGIIPLKAWIAAELAVVALAIGWTCWIAVTYGQNGNLAAARLLGSANAEAIDVQARPAMSADEDARWRLGVFYAEADDPAVIVPKRFGMGWTLNWARPASWAMVAGLIALAVIAVLASGALR